MKRRHRPPPGRSILDLESRDRWDVVIPGDLVEQQPVQPCAKECADVIGRFGLETVCAPHCAKNKPRLFLDEDVRVLPAQASASEMQHQIR